MKIKLFSPQAIFELGKRSGQEDAIFPAMGAASDLDSLYIVCDGMGGHEKGEVASSTVVNAMAEFLFQNTSPEEPLSDALFNQALEYAYQKLDAIDNGDPKKPGTTLTFLYFHRHGCTLAHIGDSRIYHIRPEERKVLYRSRDHSVVYDLYLAGEIEYEDMNKQPNKNVITKAMMPGKDNRQFANIVHVSDIKPDDYFYLCTDGMLEMMGDSEIVDILADNISDEQKRQRLIEATKDNKDNHSAYLIHIDEVTVERYDKNLPDNEVEMMAKSKRRVVDEDDTVVQMPGAPTVVATGTQAKRVPQQQHPYNAQQPLQTQQAPEERHFTKKEQTKNASRRSLLIPILTTAALLMILAGVYFTCGGKDDKKEVLKDPVEENVEKKDSVKHERDTMNIAGGETTTSALPSPSGDLLTPKPEEKKPDEKKPETTETTPAETNTNSNGVTPPTHQPVTTSEQPATPATTTDSPQPVTPPATNPTPPATETPAPVQGPRSVIPDE
ncbi:MAG: serine/threonine-protein phosphatase [Prevotella sp.]|nr:serine/threonine-protein phosphatase [Prevotella sp.]